MTDQWRSLKFIDIVSYTKKPRDLTLPKSIPFVPMDLVPLDKKKILECNYVEKVSSGTYVENGDLLLAKITPSFENGKQGILDIGHDFAYATTEVIPLKGKFKVALTDYIALFLKRPEIRDNLAGKMEGSTGRQRLSKSALDDLFVSLPPIAEQTKIVFVLNKIQNAIEQQDKLIKTTNELKKALMQKLFTEGTKGEKQKQTEIGSVPESWEIIKLGAAVKIKGGFAFKSEEGVPCSNTQLVRMGNLYMNTLDLNRAPIFYPDHYADEFPNFVLCEGDLIMSLTGTMGKEDYGFTVKVPKTDKSLLLNQRVAKFELLDDGINKDFLKQYFLSRVFLNGLYKTAKGTKQANLSSNEMKAMFLLKPGLEEQIQIANSLGWFERKAEYHQMKKRLLTDLFKTLLQELMTGERRVHAIDFGDLKKMVAANG